MGMIQDLLNHSWRTTYKVVVDDSCSMESQSDISLRNKYGNNVNITRWDEAQYNLHLYADLLIAIGVTQGFQLRFLNWNREFNIRSSTELVKAFERHSQEYKTNHAYQHENKKVRGVVKNISGQGDEEYITKMNGCSGTPLVTKMNEVFAESNPVEEGKFLRDQHQTVVIVLTDGSPSDAGRDHYQGIKDSLNRRQVVSQRVAHAHDPLSFDVGKTNTYVSFVLATDDDNVVELYEKFDNGFVGVDVNDDFKSEKKECLKKTGHKLTMPEYILKILMVFHPKYDGLDEKKEKVELGEAYNEKKDMTDEERTKMLEHEQKLFEEREARKRQREDMEHQAIIAKEMALQPEDLVNQVDNGPVNNGARKPIRKPQQKSKGGFFSCFNCHKK